MKTRAAAHPNSAPGLSPPGDLPGSKRPRRNPTSPTRRRQTRTRSGAHHPSLASLPGALPYLQSPLGLLQLCLRHARPRACCPDARSGAP